MSRLLPLIAALSISCVTTYKMPNSGFKVITDEYTTLTGECSYDLNGKTVKETHRLEINDYENNGEINSLRVTRTIGRSNINHLLCDKLNDTVRCHNLIVTEGPYREVWIGNSAERWAKAQRIYSEIRAIDRDAEIKNLCSLTVEILGLKSL